MFTRVYQYLPLFTSVCLPMFTNVYSCLLMFTLLYLCLPLFTHVYLCLLMFTYVYHYLLVHVYICDPTLEKGPYGGCVFELWTYFSRVKDCLSNGGSLITVRLSVAKLWVETHGRRNVTSSEIEAILGNFQCFRLRPCHTKKTMPLSVATPRNGAEAAIFFYNSFTIGFGIASVLIH